jgi:hypothetical protein
MATMNGGFCAMTRGVRFAVDSILILGIVIAGAFYTSVANEMDALKAKYDKQRAEYSRWAFIGDKCQNFIIDEVHAAHMETLTVASQMQAELDACRANLRSKP